MVSYKKKQAESELKLFKMCAPFVINISRKLCGQGWEINLVILKMHYMNSTALEQQ